MPKDKRTFDLEERLIDFAVRIIRIAESLPKPNKRKEKPHNSKFLVRYSIFNFVNSLMKKIEIDNMTAKSESIKKIGYACAYTPLVLIDAAGCTPYRILPMSACPHQAGQAAARQPLPARQAHPGSRHQQGSS
jgi:hypothetical protein